MAIGHLIYPFIGGCTFGLFPLFYYECEHSCTVFLCGHISLRHYLGLELGHTVTVVLTFSETARFFSKVAMPLRTGTRKFCIPSG